MGPQKKKLIQYEDVRVGWVAAIPSDGVAARSMIDEEYQLPYQKPDDENNYIVGSIADHVVAIASPADTLDSVSVTHTVWWLQRAFPRVRIRLLVGTAGGVPLFEEDLRLGDVVVSMPEGIASGVINYDNGKFAEDGFKVRGSYNKPPDLLRNAANKLRGDRAFREHRNTVEEILAAANSKRSANQERPPLTSDTLHCPNGPHSASRPTRETPCPRCGDTDLITRPERPQHLPFQVFHGLIASGRKVMTDARKRDSIARRLHKEHGYKILCYDMEAAYVVNSFPCLVIRGISNYADRWKNDDWQYWAACTAAAYAKELLLAILHEQTELERSPLHRAMTFDSFKELIGAAAAHQNRQHGHVSSHSTTTAAPLASPAVLALTQTEYGTEIGDLILAPQSLNPAPVISIPSPAHLSPETPGVPRHGYTFADALKRNLSSVGPGRAASSVVDGADPGTVAGAEEKKRSETPHAELDFV